MVRRLLAGVGLLALLLVPTLAEAQVGSSTSTPSSQSIATPAPTSTSTPTPTAAVRSPTAPSSAKATATPPLSTPSAAPSLTVSPVPSAGTATLTPTSTPTLSPPPFTIPSPGPRRSWTEVPLVAQAGGAYQAETPWGFRLELLTQGPGTASVLLRHPADGTELGFTLPGVVTGREVRGAVGIAQLPTATLRWTSYEDRLKEDLVLPARPAGDQVTFELHQRGLRFTPDRRGGYAAGTPNGLLRYHLLAPTVVDAAGRSGQASLTIDEQRQTATIQVEAAFLNGASYPITIDPTVVYADGLVIEALAISEPAGVQATTAGAPATPVTLISYQSTGYKYQVVATGGGAGFEQPGYDDSAFPTGDAAFGTTSSPNGCTLNTASWVKTAWALNSDLLVRKRFDLPAGSKGLKVSVAIDNDVQVFLNGQDISGGLKSREGCPSLGSWVFSASDTLLITGENVLAIRARDRGQSSFLDVQVTVDTDGVLSEPAPPGTEASDPKLYTEASRDPVDTLTGSFGYRRTDLAIAGRGPSPVFVRGYNSNDTRLGPLGLGWTHNYALRLRDSGDGTADLILIGPYGRSDRYTRNADGSYTPRPGVFTSLLKQPDGSYTATHPDQTRWAFDSSGRLTALTDRHGNSSSLSYDANGRLSAIADPAGRGSLSLSYDANGRLSSVTDWASPARTVQYAYDASGRLSTVTDREGKLTSYGYDGTSHRLTTITDANGHVAVTNTYDAQGRVATQRDAQGLTTGQQTSFSYVTNPDGTKTTTVTYPATSADPNWHPAEADTYDGQGRIVKRVAKPTANAADEVVVEYGYDGNGNLASVKDGRGNTTNFCYDVDASGGTISGSRGNRTRIIGSPPTAQASRPVTLFSYDGKNNLIQVIPPRGVGSGSTVTCSTNLSGSLNLAYATDFTYDASQLKLLSDSRSYTDPDLGAQTATTKYEYGDASNPGLVTKVIPPRGNTAGSPDYSYATSFSYYGSGSKAGLLQSTTDPLGNTTSYDYDAVGRRTSMVDPNGHAAGGVPSEHTWSYEYDKEDRLRFARAPAPVPGGSLLVTEFRYNPVGNRTVVLDANGQVTKYLYDERDSLQEVQQSPNAWPDPNSSPSPLLRTEYQYDPLGNLSRVIRAKGDGTYERAVDYASDGLNRLRRETQYPSWPSTSPTLVTQFGYDPNGNRTSLTDPLGQTASFSYDALNRLTGIDYADASTPDVSFSYDAHGNRATLVDGTGTTSYSYDERDALLSVTSPGSRTVGYRYDRDGHRVKLIYPDGSAVTSAFDKASQLTSLQDWASRTTSYQYWPDGALKQATYPNATTASYTYDAARRLTQLHHQTSTPSTISRHTYSLDALGNRTRLDELVPGAQAIDYGYDKLSRLTSVTAPSGSTSYSYDPVGNRLSLTRGTTTSYSYDRADRLTAAGATGYTVDANGNTTARGGDSFAYDQANRLTSATVTGASVSYAWDGDGKRTSATSGGSTTSYLYDVNGGLPVLLEDGSRKYVWGLGLAYAVDGAGTIEVYHTDGLGSVRALTNASQTVVARYESDEFGVPTTTTGTSSQPFGYTGEQQDSQTGLVYLRARMYEPGVGRFLQRDESWGELTSPPTLHRFTYVENNPLNRTDPSGLKSSVLAYCDQRGLASSTALVATSFIFCVPVCLPPQGCRFVCIDKGQPPVAAPFRPATEDCPEECESACSAERVRCEQDAWRQRIPIGGSGCLEGYAQCVATGGCFRNPGWRQGPGSPEWDQVWWGRQGSCDE